MQISKAAFGLFKRLGSRGNDENKPQTPVSDGHRRSSSVPAVEDGILPHHDPSDNRDRFSTARSHISSVQVVHDIEFSPYGSSLASVETSSVPSSIHHHDPSTTLTSPAINIPNMRKTSENNVQNTAPLHLSQKLIYQEPLSLRTAELADGERKSINSISRSHLRDSSLRPASQKSYNSDLARSFVHNRQASCCDAVDASSFSHLGATPAVEFLANIAEQTSIGVRGRISIDSADSAVETAYTGADDIGDEIRGYVLGPVIAEGGFSVIRQCARHDGETFGFPFLAIKIVRRAVTSESDKPISTAYSPVWMMHAPSPQPIQNGKKFMSEEEEHEACIKREVQIWTRAKHPAILPLLDAFSNVRAHYFVSPYCRGGSMIQVMNACKQGRVGPRCCRAILRPIISAVIYLHEELRVVHADIKLENILCLNDVFDLEHTGLMSMEEMESDVVCRALENSVRLVDFGLAQYMDVSQHSMERSVEGFSLPGSIPYCSPERLRSDTGKLEPAADAWSLGVVAFTLLQGEFPFKDGFEPRLMQNIMRGTYTWIHPVVEEAKTCVDGLLLRDVPLRWTARQALASPWLSL